LLDIIAQLSSDGTIEVSGGRLEADTLTNELLGELLVTGIGAEVNGVIDFINRGSATAELGATLDSGALTNFKTLSIQTGATALAETFVTEIGGSSTITNATTSMSVLGNITNKGLFDITDHAGVTGASIVNYAELNIDDANFSVNSMLNTDAGDVTVGGSSALFNVNGAIVNEGKLTAELGSESLVVSIDNHHLFDVFTGARLTLESILNFASGNIDVADADTQLTLTNNLQNLGAVTVRETGKLTALSVTNLGGFTLRSGGIVNTESVLNTSDSTVLVTGLNTALILTDNFKNDGSLTVTDQGTLNAASLENTSETQISIAATVSTNSLRNTTTGTFTVGGPMTTVAAAVAIVNQGLFEVSNGAVVSASSFDQSAGQTTIAGGTLGGLNLGVNIAAGDLVGFGDLSSDLNVGLAGTLAPGSSLDKTNAFDVDGALLLGGTLSIDIAGSAASDFDRIVASGDILLGGILDVSLLSGFEPIVGSSFDILLGSSVAGSFSSTLFPVFDGRTFDIVLGAEFFRLTVSAIPIPAAVYLFVPGCLLLFTRRRSE